MSFNLCQIDAITSEASINEIPKYDARQIKEYLLDLIWAPVHICGKKVYAKFIFKLECVIFFCLPVASCHNHNSDGSVHACFIEVFLKFNFSGMTLDGSRIFTLQTHLLEEWILQT